MSAFSSLRAKLALGGTTILGLVLADYGLSFYAHRRRYRKIDEAVSLGTRLRLLSPQADAHVDRKHLKELIYNKFYHLHSDQGFGVVIGPSGSGKTALIREMCNLYPEGTLYIEATDYNIPVQLANVIGLPIDAQKPALLKSLLGRIRSRYEFLESLPEKRSEALQKVLCILQERIALYQKESGRTTRLFIDGADLIAKYQPDLFVTLLDQAKVFANEKDFCIILISTEGDAMPLIEGTSSSSRKARIIEVGDTDASNAKEYLRKNGIVSEKLLQDVLELVGGRLWFLRVTTSLYAETQLSDEHFYANLKEYMFEETKRSLFKVNLKDKDIQKILAAVCNDMSRSQITELLVTRGLTYEQGNALIHCLVKADVLRYSFDGEVKWHSQCVKKYLQDKGLIGTI